MKNWKRWCRGSIAEMREMQNLQLRYFIQRQLYPFSPYYRRLFKKQGLAPERIRTVQDLHYIPFTNKSDLLPTTEDPARHRQFVLQPNKSTLRQYASPGRLLLWSLLKWIRGADVVMRRIELEYRPIFLTATTGTTQKPVAFLYTRRDMDNLAMAGDRLMDVSGGPGDIRAISMFPYAPHLAFWQTVLAALEHDNFLLSTGGGKVMSTMAHIETILQVRPHILIGVPSYVYHVVRSAAEAGKKFPFIRIVILGASAVPVGFKRKLSELLMGMGADRLNILGTYGLTEARMAWGECPTTIDVSSGYHTYPDMEVFEVVDPATGEIKAEGEDGELVYTGIGGRGTCVLRYRTGDFVRGGITWTPCPHCGRTVPRISSDISRLFNVKDLWLSKVKGTLVNLSFFETLLESERDVDEFQVEIRKKNNDPFEVDELAVYLSVRAGTNARTLMEALKEKIKQSSEISPNEIKILPRSEMLERLEMESSRKIKRIVDKRPTGG